MNNNYAVEMSNDGKSYQQQPYQQQPYQQQSYQQPYQQQPYLNDDYPPNVDQPYNQPYYNQQNMQDVTINNQDVNTDRAKINEPLAHLDDGLAGKARKKFIMKVYMILAIQFLITAGMCFASMYSQAFMFWQVENYWLMWTLLGIILIVEIVIFCCPAGRKHPINLVLLLIFTLGESYIVSYICAIVTYANQDNGMIVIAAACMTLGIVTALSLYAIFTRTDFTTMGGILIVLCLSLCIFGLFCIWSYWLYNLYCMFGVIIFGIYLVYDTQLIVGGKRLELSMDDYVVGALILYIDIIQIFLYLLMLLGRR